MRRLEVKLQSFLKVGKSFLFGLTLACDVDFETLRNVPVSLTPDGCAEGLRLSIFFHDCSGVSRLDGASCTGRKIADVKGHIKSEDMFLSLRLVLSAIPALIIVMAIVGDEPLLEKLVYMVFCGAILLGMWRDFDREEIRDFVDRRKITTLFGDSDRNR